VNGGSSFPLLARAIELDARLLAVRKRTQRIAIAVTLIAIACLWIQYVPREYADYTRWPLLKHVKQYDTYGTDTLSDMYESRVILHDPGDMYTKRETSQTPLEASRWSREESGPYPPAVLLSEAGLYRVGEWTGIGFYGMILALACLFLALSALYFLKTRWYLFPLLYLNGLYFGYRFVYVQDSTYLVMLVVIMAALFAARQRWGVAHPLVAIAITMKLSPLYYAKNVLGMQRPMAALFIAVLIAGLVLPYFAWGNYLYIYRFQGSLKGDWYDTFSAVLFAVPFAALLWYVETRRDFDMEDRIGWGLVPFAMFLGIKMNVARHLLIVLLVPDKRGVRNIAAAVGMGLPNLLPWFIRFNSSLSITNALLFVALTYHLDQIGWDVVRNDFRHASRTAKMMLVPSLHVSQTHPCHRRRLSDPAVRVAANLPVPGAAVLRGPATLESVRGQARDVAPSQLPRPRPHMGRADEWRAE
jgi:hypothetical protein